MNTINGRYTSIGYKTYEHTITLLADASGTGLLSHCDCNLHDKIDLFCHGSLHSVHGTHI